MKRQYLILGLSLTLVVLSGCAKILGQNFEGSIFNPDRDTVRPVARPGDVVNIPPQNARSVEDFDTTSAGERSQAEATNAGEGRELGTTVASLGNPARPGFWLETPLVNAPAMGRVVLADTGKSVRVDLIPIDGPATGGSRISLAALRLLGVALTSLPELIVYGR